MAKRRNRMEVVFYTAGRSRLSWSTKPGHDHPLPELAKYLRFIADQIDATIAADAEGPGEAVATVTKAVNAEA